MAMEKLTLSPGSWYVWQMYPGYSTVPYVSPIRILDVTPRKTGRKELEVSFYNAFYAPGLRDFKAVIRLLAHQPLFLMALVAPFDSTEGEKRACVIHGLSDEWLERLLPELADRWRLRAPENADEELSIYLEDS